MYTAMVSQKDVSGIKMTAKQMLTASENIPPVVLSTLMVTMCHVPTDQMDGEAMLVHAVSKLFKEEDSA